MVPPPGYEPKSKLSPAQACLVVSGVAGCGCLGSIMIAISTGAGIWNFFSDAVRSTGSYQAYQMAEIRLSNDTQVHKAIGAPIEVSWFSKSHESVKNGRSQVCMRVSVTGDRKSGSAYLETKKVDNSWQWHQLILDVNGEADPLILEAADGPSLCPGFDQPNDSDPSNDEETVEAISELLQIAFTEELDTSRLR